MAADGGIPLTPSVDRPTGDPRSNERPPMSQAEAEARGLPWRPYGDCTPEARAFLEGVDRLRERYEEEERAKAGEPIRLSYTAKDDAPLRFRLIAYVTELRERKSETTGGDRGLVSWQIADELEKLLDA